MTSPKSTPTIRTSSGFGSIGLTARIVLTFTGALALVMIVAGIAFYSWCAVVVRDKQDDAIVAAMPLSAKSPAFDYEGESVRQGAERVSVTPVRIGAKPGQPGTVYEFQKVEGVGEPERLFVPATAQDAGKFLLPIATLCAAVVAAGAGIGLLVSNIIRKPLDAIADRIRQMSGEGDKPRSTKSSMENVEVLAHSVGRVSRALSQGRDAEQRLSVRQRELDLAVGVREALLPSGTPDLPGWDIGAAHFPSERFGGDFHDYIELSEGRVGLLACDVSGQGLPAAMIGAAARSYLRAELAHGGELAEALRRVNREVVRDVRRGMYVTLLYVLLDTRKARAQVACAGHKIPLLRYVAADRKLRTLQPEGIALGLDQGSVFDRTLKIQELSLEPGDRLLLSNTGPVRMPDPAGKEFGEQQFYARVLQGAALDTPALFKLLRKVLQVHAGSEEAFPLDVSLVTVART